MNKFVKSLITEWRQLQLPLQQQTYVLAVSGGADSLALTLAIKDLVAKGKIKCKFVIAHFNHRLRGAESDEDEEFTKRLAADCGFEIITQKNNLPLSKSNLEEQARKLRYDFLTGVAEKFDAYGILTAHTINDQAETFLMNLIRGSGFRGLSAIKPLRKILHKNREFLIIRPLVRWATRSETEDFCLKCGMQFRLDEMNQDKSFTRVRIRRELIPFLQTFNPNIVNILSRTAALISEEDAILNELVTLSDNSELKTKELQKFSSALRRRILRMWLEKHRGHLRGLTSVHIAAIDNLISSRKSGRVVELPKGDKILKSNGKLYFKKAQLDEALDKGI